MDEILDVATKFDYNPLKSTGSIRHPQDPTPEQTKYINGRNWVQIKRLRFLDYIFCFKA
jgi:hypothetical protein